MNSKYLLMLVLCSLCIPTLAQDKKWTGKFEQLGTTLPTPNQIRDASGAPGPAYWQNRADYDMDVVVNDDNQTLQGSEKITYYNNSPVALNYLWLQLDQNLFKDGSDGQVSQSSFLVKDSLTAKSYAGNFNLYNFDGGYKLEAVRDNAGAPMNYTINQTMMRLDLPKPLKSGEQVSFTITWKFNIVDRNKFWARSGYEYFEEDKNYTYHIAQFFPRMCVFDDLEGWQNKQFMGRAEFALPFGNYKVKITVPADHIVAATGTLQNPSEVLSKIEQERFQKAKKSFDTPILIVNEQEARQKEKTKAKSTKTWIYHATDVRDFAFASSRKFIWDAMAVQLDTNTPLAMSYYSKEGNPLWEKESTKAVKNTLLTYSKHTIEYPYPVAISVHAPNIGMEYPMICFNYGRPKKDGSYSEQLKNAMIAVIIHEVGHNFFPMIINSDERESTWMDEGLNTFVQYLTEQENYPNFPSSRGPAAKIVPYMKGDKTLHRPLMTGGEQVVLAGAEQYGKAGTGLNILRETIMGRELFDKAFKEYAQRWAFKHPKPSDFFRTMEDASGVDLDWFWRGWFYTTDVVDISIDKVKWFKMLDEKQSPEQRVKSSSKGDLSGSNENALAGEPTYVTVINTPESAYTEYRSKIDDNQIKDSMRGKNIYEVTFQNKGGMVMPLMVEFIYKDGSKETRKVPAEVWRLNEAEVTKTFITEKEVAKINLDPSLETADVDISDNVYPRQSSQSRFDQMKNKN